MSNARPANNNRMSIQPSTTPLLMPRLFHFVWVGDNPFPIKDAAWLASWLTHHPDWRAVLWAESPGTLGSGLSELANARPQTSDFDSSGTPRGSGIPPALEVRLLPPLVNQRFFDGIEQWVTGRAVLAARSDIVRMEIVARFGGVYLDTDVECFQSAESVLRGVRLFYSDEWGPSVGNYMFGGVANHPALWTLVRELGPHLTSHTSALNAVEATGPAYLAPRLRAHPDCVIFPHMLFNPLCAYDDPAQVTQWPPVSLANHHYDGKWYDREKATPPPEFLGK